MIKLAISLVVGGAVAITLPTYALEQPEPPVIPPAVLRPSKAIEPAETVEAAPEPEKPVTVPSTLPVEPIVTDVGDDNAAGSVESIVRQAAITHGLDPDYFWSIALCESSGNPNAVNYSYYAGGGNPSGVFQFLPETWTRISSRSPYGVGDVFNAWDNAHVAAWAWANGYSGEWECKG